MATSEAYCMKCKKKREMKDVKEVVMKNSRLAQKGRCGHCDTNMFKILGTKKGGVSGGAYKKSRKSRKSKKSAKVGGKSKKSAKPRRSRRSRKIKV